MTLLDELIPVYDVAARYETRVRASPATVYGAVWSADLDASPLTRVLLRLRGVGIARRPRGVTLRDVTRHGFAVLGQRPGEEVVLGTIGRFWRLTGALRPATPRDFAADLAPGLARAAWAFHVAGAGPGRTVLSTETRVHCADAATRRRFTLYWAVVGSASGWIRRAMLRAIRRAAEAVDDPARRQPAA